MNSSNRKKRRSRQQKAQAMEEARYAPTHSPEAFMAEHRGGTFRVYDKKTKESYRGLSWEEAVQKWNELGTAIILDH